MGQRAVVRGVVVDHVSLRVADLEASRRFYACLENSGMGSDRVFLVLLRVTKRLPGCCATVTHTCATGCSLFIGERDRRLAAIHKKAVVLLDKRKIEDRL